MLTVLLIYFGVLLILSRWVARKDDNDTFFRGNRRSPWWLVSFGMIGASISGLTFIGVPGWVITTDMTYMQMCFGFVVGYLIVAFVLLPLYYRLRLTSIYSYLSMRFGSASYATGSAFFILSKLLGASAKFYVVVRVLQTCVGEQYGLSYEATAAMTLAFIWLYTHRSGIRSLVWTDAVQTLVLIVCLVLILLRVCSMLEMGVPQAWQAVWQDSHSRMFEFGNLVSRQYFWKQFLSGVFVVIVMTGLDQDMMQKNLTCRSLREAQLNMCTYGVMFVPVNFLFLSLGILLLMLYARLGMPLPDSGDALLTNVVFSGTLGHAALVFFTVGVVASAFSSADSALTALTTTFCIDILHMESDSILGAEIALKKERTRKWVHLGMMLLFLLFTLAFNVLDGGSVMDLIYTLVSYTYGPLLGLFAFGLLTNRRPVDHYVIFMAVLAPLLCIAIEYASRYFLSYRFGYEMLMFNGLLTFVGLYLLPVSSSVPRENRSDNVGRAGRGL